MAICLRSCARAREPHPTHRHHHHHHAHTAIATARRHFPPGELLSDREAKVSSGSETTMIPNTTLRTHHHSSVPVLNCQLFTQEITEAVILCKYSRCKKNLATSKTHFVCVRTSLPSFLELGLHAPLLDRSAKKKEVQLCSLNLLEETLCILRAYPTSAESDQLDLLCCQPEPFADASTPLDGRFSASTHWRLSARLGAPICMHEVTWQARLQSHT